MQCVGGNNDAHIVGARQMLCFSRSLLDRVRVRVRVRVFTEYITTVLKWCSNP